MCVLCVSVCVGVCSVHVYVCVGSFNGEICSYRNYQPHNVPPEFSMEQLMDSLVGCYKEGNKVVVKSYVGLKNFNCTGNFLGSCIPKFRVEK